MGYVQSKSTSTDSTSSTTTAVTLTTANITPGNKIVGLCFWNNNADDIVSIADNVSASNVYTVVDTLSNNDIQKTFYADIVVGGAATITVTTTGAHGFRGIVVHEVSGLLAGAPDKHALVNQAAPGTGTDAVTSGAVVPTTNGQYIFGATHVNNVLVMTVTPGTGYTGRESIDGTAAISPLESEDQIQVTAASIAATFTENSNQQCATGIMTFKAVAAAGTSIGLPTSFHPGQSPGLGGISSARFQPSNWWPYTFVPPLAFDPAFMSAMEKHGNDPLILLPQVVASGMTPPEAMPT